MQITIRKSTQRYRFKTLTRVKIIELTNQNKTPPWPNSNTPCDVTWKFSSCANTSSEPWQTEYANEMSDVTTNTRRILVALSKWPIKKCHQYQFSHSSSDGNSPNASPNIITLISVESKKNLTKTHNIISVYPPTTDVEFTSIETKHLRTLIITFTTTWKQKHSIGRVSL